MSYRARCHDGPCVEIERHISAGRVPQRIWFARFPEHLTAGTGFSPPFGGWVLVGMADPGPGGPSEPWEEQAEYRLSEDLSEVRAGAEPRMGDEPPWAVYVLVEHRREPNGRIAGLASA